MTSFPYILFVLCLGLASASIFFSSHLHKKYALPYLTTLNYYVIAAAVDGFFSMLGPVLAIPLLAGHSLDRLALDMPLLMMLIAFPALIIKVYFLIVLSREIGEGKVTVVFKRTYGLVSLFFFLLYILTIKYYFDSGSKTWLFGFIRSLIALVMIIQILTILSMYTSHKVSMDGKKIKGKKIFTSAFLTSFSLFVLAFYFPTIIKSAYSWFFLQMGTILYFLVPLPPLLFIKKFLEKYYLGHPLQAMNGNQFKDFCAKHQLTEREHEIANLLLKGSTKNEMAEALFLSPHTVRNHLACIYKKLEIKNKMQFFYLVQNFYSAAGISKISPSSMPVDPQNS